MYWHVKLVFCIFSAIVFFSFVYSGKMMSRTHNDKLYWKYASVSIIAFTLFYGLRFGRLIDYNLYEERYHALGVHLDDEYELLFRYLCHYAASWGIHYQFLILLISFLTVFSMFFLFKDEKYRKALLYILLCLLPVTIPVEQLVRWYFAASFYIFSIYFFIKADYIKFGVFSAGACLIHIGYVPLIVFFIVIYYIRFQLIPSKFCILLLIVSVFLGKTQMLENFAQYVNILSLNEKSSAYVESFSTLVTEGTRGIGIREVGFTTQIRIILAYSFPLLLLNKLKEKKVHYWLINTFCIGIILSPIFGKVEILDRYANIIMLMSAPIVVGMSFYCFFSQYSHYSWPMKSFGILSLISNIYPIISNWFGRTDWWYMLFIWDANGRSVLPMFYFTN